MHMPESEIFWGNSQYSTSPPVRKVYRGPIDPPLKYSPDRDTVAWRTRDFYFIEVDLDVEIELRTGGVFIGRIMEREARLLVEEHNGRRHTQSTIYRWRRRLSTEGPAKTEVVEANNATSTTKEISDMKFAATAVRVKDGYLGQVLYHSDYSRNGEIVWESPVPVDPSRLTEKQLEQPKTEHDYFLQELATQDARDEIAQRARELFAGDAPADEAPATATATAKKAAPATK